MTHTHAKPWSRDRIATPTEQNTVWAAIHQHTTTHGHQPLPVSELAATTGMDQHTVRAAIRTLRRRGLLHIQRRCTATGSQAPSRYRCVLPRTRDPHQGLARLMVETPRGR
jgi:predicted transcriptional regulator